MLELSDCTIIKRAPPRAGIDVFCMKDDNNKTPTQAEIKKQQESAADIVRGKLAAIYKDEPGAQEEIAELAAVGTSNLSVHQAYMQKLSTSGRSMSEIQTAWHEYYQNLPDEKKHEVWQEFYQAHEERSKPKPKAPKARPPQQIVAPVQSGAVISTAPRKPKLSTAAIKKDLLKRVNTQSKANAKHHAKALLFGLSMGGLVVFILLFSFFNERFITPFIKPGHAIGATPIIVDPNSNAPVGPEPKIIIPKIDIAAPVVYDVPTIEESDVQKGLERGVVHYATTPNPGEKGNAVIFGHSSGNILNKGQYKFAFLLLKSLENGDTFIIHKDSKQYVYKVYMKYVTSPTDVSVLNPRDKTATVTLITCDPPGLSTNRLIVVAEQIFPDPNANAASTITATDQPEVLPSNSPSLWQRIKNWF